MKKISLIIGLLLSFRSEAFILLNPVFKVNNPKNTKLMISSEGCTANGLSDGELKKALEYSVEFWNDVPESKLKLSYGGKSSASLNDASIPASQIIVGCGSLPSINILGATQNDYATGGARVELNEAVYTGNYDAKSLYGTIAHEVGHGLGLNHSKDPASVMTYEANGWSPKPSYISQDDIEGIVYLYPNDKSAGGLAGSCSSFAGESAPRPEFLFEVILSFLSVLGISMIVKKIFAFIK